MIIPRGNQVVQNRQTTSGRMESSGTQSSMQMGSTAIGFVQKYYQEKDESQYQEAVNTALKKKNEWKSANLTREGKAAEGLTEDFLSFNREVEEEIGGNLSTNAKAKFNQWQTRDTEQDKLGVMLHQRKQDQFVKQSTFQEGLSISQEAIRLDAKGNRNKAFEHAELTLQNGLNSGVIAPEQYEAKRMEVMNGLRTDTAKSYYMQDKHDFMRSGINELGFGETEKAYWDDKYANDLEADKREKKSLYSEEYRQIMSSVDDMDAQAVRNKTTQYHHEGAKKLEAMGYGEAAKELTQRAAVYDNVNVHGDKTRNMSLIEKGEVIRGYKLPEGLDGSSVENKSQIAIAQEYDKEVKLFKADPAEFVSNFVVGRNDEERASSRLALQEKQGIVPKEGYQVLTKTEKESFTAAWNSTPDVQKKAAMAKEFMKYGKFAPKAIGELGINKSLALLPLLDNDQDIDLFVAGAADDKAYSVDETNKKDYTAQNKGSKFYQLLADVQGSFPTNPDLPSKIADIDKAMTGISARKVDPKAGPDFFDSKFNVMNEGDKKIYFPKSIDEDEVEERLDTVKQEILTKYATGNAVSKMALRDTVWVNTQNGYVLADPRTGQALSYPEAEIDMLDLDPVRKEHARKIKAEKEQTYTANPIYMRR